MKSLIFTIAMLNSINALAEGPAKEVFLEGQFEDGRSCRISYKLEELKASQAYAISDFDIFNDRGLENFNTGLLNKVQEVKKANLSRNGYVGTAEYEGEKAKYDIRMRFSGRDLSNPGSFRSETRQGSFLFGNNGEVYCKDLKPVSQRAFKQARMEAMAQEEIRSSRERCERAANIRANDREQTSGLNRLELDSYAERDRRKCEKMADRRLRNLKAVKMKEDEKLPNSSVEFAGTRTFLDLSNEEEAANMHRGEENEYPASVGELK